MSTSKRNHKKDKVSKTLEHTEMKVAVQAAFEIRAKKKSEKKEAVKENSKQYLNSPNARNRET